MQNIKESLKMNRISESFEWVPESWKLLPTRTNEVKVKMVIAKAGQISGNGRKYVREELNKAARTLDNQPINVNHDKKRVIGTIKATEYNDIEDQLEAVGIINSPMYTERIRANDPSWKGWSMQADYFYNECIHCHKRFESEESFMTHLIEEHNLKNNTIIEPHGIRFNGVAYVEAPEVPGLTGTKYEIMETKKKGKLELWETIIKEKEEWRKKAMANIPAVITSEKHINIEQAKRLKEQEEPTQVEPTHECGEGEHWDEKENKCVPNKVEEQEHECPEGEHWSDTEGKCVPDKKEEEPTREAKEMHFGEPCSPELKACVDALIRDGKPEDSAWAICRSKIGESIKELKVIKAEAIATSKPIKPFNTIDEYVANGHSVDEGALILKQHLDETEFRKGVAETFAKVVANEDIQMHNVLALKAEVEQKLTEIYTLFSKVDKNLTETIKQLPKDDLGWKEPIKKLETTMKTINTNLQTLTETIQAIPQDDLAWKEQIVDLKAEQDKFLTELTTKLTNYKTAVETPVGNLTKEVAEIKQKLEENTTLKANETVEVKTRLDNIEAKIKGRFKANASTQPATDDSVKNPLG